MKKVKMANTRPIKKGLYIDDDRGNRFKILSVDTKRGRLKVEHVVSHRVYVDVPFDQFKWSP